MNEEGKKTGVTGVIGDQGPKGQVLDLPTFEQNKEWISKVFCENMELKNEIARLKNLIKSQAAYIAKSMV